MTETQEEWRPVVGFEGCYEVSSLGRVRSLTRMVNAGGGRMRLATGRIMSIYSGGHYSKVRLKVDGIGSTKNVHALVAEAFLGPRPEGMEVCHNNGAQHDNRLANLHYDTHPANQREQVAHGTHAEASRTHCDHGHEFTPENTSSRGHGGGRRCRTCERDRTARRAKAGEFRKKAS